MAHTHTCNLRSRSQPVSGVESLGAKETMNMVWNWAVQHAAAFFLFVLNVVVSVAIVAWASELQWLVREWPQRKLKLMQEERRKEWHKAKDDLYELVLWLAREAALALARICGALFGLFLFCILDVFMLRHYKIYTRNELLFITATAFLLTFLFVLVKTGWRVILMVTGVSVLRKREQDALDEAR
jgi:hypothetical protein